MEYGIALKRQHIRVFASLSIRGEKKKNRKNVQNVKQYFMHNYMSRCASDLPLVQICKAPKPKVRRVTYEENAN